MENDPSKCASVLQGNDVFVHKILSRKSSVGCSSRYYHCKKLGEIPFKWEVEPGRSKEPQNDQKCTVAPPAPAMHSHAFVAQRPKPPLVRRPRVWFWKRLNKNKFNKKQLQKGLRTNGVSGDFNETIANLGKLEEINSDQDQYSESSPTNTPALSSSLTRGSSTSSKSLARGSSRFRGLAKLLIRWNK